MYLKTTKLIICILSVCSLLLTYSCANKNKSIEPNNPDVLHFDVSKWETKTTIPKKVIKSISFIPLETSEQCLIGTVGKIVALNDKYYIIDSQYANGVLVFNKEGKYIKSIGKKGRGKGEFLRLNSFCIDEKGGEMLILDSYARKVLFYNLTNGVYLEDIKLNFLPRGIDMVGNKILI